MTTPVDGTVRVYDSVPFVAVIVSPAYLVSQTTASVAIWNVPEYVIYSVTSYDKTSSVSELATVHVPKSGAPNTRRTLL